MSDRIKKIKIKQTDGTFSDYIPIGANAKDIDLQYNGSNVENTLKKKPYYYDNVSTMKLDDTLREGDMAITLGYYEANDGGGAEYEITDNSELLDDGGSIHDLNNGLKAKIKIFNNLISVTQLGGKKDTDITNIIKLAMNLKFSYIVIDIDCSISEFVISSPIIIDGMNHTIKLIRSQGSTGDCLITNNSNSIIKNLIFDGQGQYAYGIIKNKNTYNCTIEKCTFQNFKHTNKQLQLNVIHVLQGSTTKIEQCTFKNIKIIGNGTITDNGGTGRCIRTYDDTESTDNVTNLIIDKCLFENNYNIDDNGDFIIEDFDNIHLQNNNGNNNITISNILSINSGKRVIKCQASNVDITNVTSINNDIRVESFIACMADNINISNCYSNNSYASNGIEISDANNINISNVNIIDHGIHNTSGYNYGITLIKCKNVNINNYRTSGFGGNLKIWDSSENINFSNCIFNESQLDVLNITTRTASDYSIQSGIIIKDINFNNCTFYSNGTLENIRIFDINETYSNKIDNINFTNCNIKINETKYQYGIIRDNSSESKYSNCNFNINDTQSNIYICVFEKGITHISSCSITTSNNYSPRLVMGGSSRIYFNNLIAPNITCYFNTSSDNNPKAVINYCNFESISNNTEENCAINSFDMS